jgi:VanZ family protein
MEPPECTKAPSTLQKFAQFAAVGICIVLLVGSVFGRTLERGFPEYIPLIPHLAAVFVLSSLLATLIYSVRQVRSSRITISRDRILAVCLLAPATALLVVATCETMIVAPIERIHFVKYGMLCVFLFFSQQAPRSITQLGAAALLSLSIGIVEECLQFFVPDRVFDFRDILLNTSAVLAGSALAGLLYLLKSCFRIATPQT